MKSSTAAQHPRPLQQHPLPQQHLHPPRGCSVADGTKVNAPMPGTILEVKVAVGDTVEAGQALAVLEAMKMENDISSPCAGKVLSVNTTKGAAVETGTLICVIG